MFKTIKKGQLYFKTWPLHPKLGMIFPENRVIKAIIFAQQIMPFIAVFSIVWWYVFSLYSMGAFVIAVMSALFALLIPVQGIWWLGKRANRVLNENEIKELNLIAKALHQKQIALPQRQEEATGLDLAVLLKLASQYLEDDFWKNI